MNQSNHTDSSRRRNALVLALSMSALLANTNNAMINAGFAAEPQAKPKTTVSVPGTQTKKTTKVSASKTVTPKGTTTTTKKSVTTAQQPIRLKIIVPCRAWVPKNAQPKVVLLCVHGLGLNSESYTDFGQQMQKAGIAVFAVDVRGFGTWMKFKGKATCNFKSCISDVQQALQVLHAAYPDKPIFLLGESMGGAIALHIAAEHQDLIDGLISSVPSGDRFHTKKNDLTVALHLVTLRGNKPIDVGTKVIEEATKDSSMRAKWAEDPFDRLQLSSKELMQFQKFMNENHEYAKSIDKTPVLFLVGLMDNLVKPQGTIDLYNEIPDEDKKLITIKHSEHLIFELHKISPELQGVLINWLLSHPKKSIKGMLHSQG
jgi:alpha-beta hydrolase superfamily lysophospholipase